MSEQLLPLEDRLEPNEPVVREAVRAEAKTVKQCVAFTAFFLYVLMFIVVYYAVRHGSDFFTPTIEKVVVSASMKNTSVDPCVDFKSYACGKYEALYPDTSIASSTESLNDRTFFSRYPEHVVPPNTTIVPYPSMGIFGCASVYRYPSAVYIGEPPYVPVTTDALIGAPVELIDFVSGVRVPVYLCSINWTEACAAVSAEMLYTAIEAETSSFQGYSRYYAVDTNLV